MILAELVAQPAQCCAAGCDYDVCQSFASVCVSVRDCRGCRSKQPVPCRGLQVARPLSRAQSPQPNLDSGLRHLRKRHPLPARSRGQTLVNAALQSLTSHCHPRRRACCYCGAGATMLPLEKCGHQCGGLGAVAVLSARISVSLGVRNTYSSQAQVRAKKLIQKNRRQQSPPTSRHQICICRQSETNLFSCWTL